MATYVSAAVRPPEGAPDLICFSHLRWDFVLQRPQHLLSRAAANRRTFYIEEPLFTAGSSHLALRTTPEGVFVVTPHLPGGLSPTDAEATLRRLIDQLLVDQKLERYLLWYYTPMALGFTRHLQPCAVVFDVMDELSLFRFAPPELLEREAELLRRADVVFTGGRSLFEAKRDRHPNVHLFPSSVDAEHFATARTRTDDPDDQAAIPHPRLGFYGVIDERMDLDLVSAVADDRPNWQLVLVGPVVKIDPAALPQRPNIHYLGAKGYVDLPRYASGWDVALMPWALNEATRFISPTKTPEYLASGLPVVSTPVADVVRQFGEAGLVRIAEGPAAFLRETEAILEEDSEQRAGWQRQVDALLASTSWAQTWNAMEREIAAVTRHAPVAEPMEIQPHVRPRAALRIHDHV